MAVPDFQSFFLPFLKAVGDGKVYSISEIMDKLAKEFKLSQKDLKVMLPSGKQTVFRNRVSWAKTYLSKALLLEIPQRGMVKITPRGKEVLKSNPAKIDNEYLMRFPEFAEFRIGIKTNGQQASIDVSDIGDKMSPVEALEKGYQAIRQQLKKELLDQIMQCSPAFFEKLVVDLLLAMGYGGSREDARQRIGGNGDGEVDGIIKEDKLGLDVIYIQAKRWKNSVGLPELQAFAGSLMGFAANKGVFITTSTFTDAAKNFVKSIDKKIVLIDGEELASLMIDHDVGVNVETQYVVKKIDSDYFVEE
jgi:restriction system protein